MIKPPIYQPASLAACEHGQIRLKKISPPPPPWIPRHPVYAVIFSLFWWARRARRVQLTLNVIMKQNLYLGLGSQEKKKENSRSPIIICIYFAHNVIAEPAPSLLARVNNNNRAAAYWNRRAQTHTQSGSEHTIYKLHITNITTSKSPEYERKVLMAL